ncbi:DUF6051 family protein [Maribellus sp. YY47]|uniref:DUF6051 family protein n=1 Tax=Maribellus sp. YY47 TaxID=2929486 RepID=UPI002000BC4E|nr:DUF6051 family protein [Maribellus sp. YY47]MCK3684670.1 DUF6051 family protein [Maribellus sp. YY47]
MQYTNDYHALKLLFESKAPDKTYDSIELNEAHFTSRSSQILPGTENYHCDFHDQKLSSHFSFYTEIGTLDNHVHIKDIFVEENQQFNYQILAPKGSKKAKKVTFLFHGFNEKKWDKYLPWAKAIYEGTGSTVVLFPIAFHMQRAPLYWSSKKEMYRLSELRKERFPNIVNSTLSNVAISMRLHSMPQRFIWSGLQTYYDVIQLIEDCKNGNHPYIDKDFEFNIFAYSIGGFLAQILKLTNHKNYFDHSKVGLFCSGAAFNRISPVSRFILDSEANVALYSFLVEHFDKIVQKDELLHHYIKENHSEGTVFYSMLDFQRMRDFREALLKKYEDQFFAISLKKDDVIPPFEIINTMNGAFRDINIRVENMDFEHQYTHENPFPSNRKETKIVDKNFNLVFDKVCRFFNE